MISSIFYFANTEQEYLDNFNNHQVKPYTIVFCKDTHTLWKDGIKYGGDTARTEAQISDWVETNITPLINQLQDAMDAANDAAGEEKERLDGMIGGINDLIKDEVENMLGDSEWIQENWPQGVTQWQSGWNEDLESYLTNVGYWDVDPVTGEKTTKWSKLEQSVDSINSSVGRINTNIGTTELLLSSLKQLITDEGTARTNLENRWIQKESDTEKILKWMYSGLTTESGRDKTFADLKAAAQDGETTGISTIGAIVEKVPVIDPQTGDPQLDQDGNIVYQKDSNNNYVYRAKSTLSSALNDSLATMINESTENTATSLVITSVGDCIAALRNEVIDGRGAYASLGAKFAGMEAGFVAKADLNEAVAGLVIDGVRTVKLTVLNSLPSGASYFNTTQQLPSELDLHTKLKYTVSEFTALINTIFVHKQVAPDTWDDVPASYGADLTYDVHPGSYLKCSDDKYLYIEEISFSSSVFSRVDGKIGEATSGLVAKNELTGKVALILATVGEDGSGITLDADQLNITSTFIDAMNAELNVGRVTTELILAALAEGLTIKAGKVNFQKADGTAAPISINVNDGTLLAENASITGAFTSSSDLAKIIINTQTRTEQHDPNSVLNTVSSSILMQAYNNMTYDEVVYNEGEDNEYYDYELKKTAQSLLVDVLTIGVNEIFLLDDGGSQILNVGYDGMIRINSTAGSGRVATFSPDNISCYDGYGAGASLAYGTIRASGFSRDLTPEEKNSYAQDTTYIPNGVSKYNLSMGFSSSGGGALGVITKTPYANGYTTLSGTYGSDMLTLSENNSYNNSNTYTKLVAGQDARLEFDDGSADGTVVIGINGISIGNNWSITWNQFKSKLA